MGQNLPDARSHLLLLQSPHDNEPKAHHLPRAKCPCHWLEASGARKHMRGARDRVLLGQHTRACAQEVQGSADTLGLKVHPLFLLSPHQTTCGYSHIPWRNYRSSTNSQPWLNQLRKPEHRTHEACTRPRASDANYLWHFTAETLLLGYYL